MQHRLLRCHIRDERTFCLLIELGGRDDIDRTIYDLMILTTYSQLYLTQGNDVLIENMTAILLVCI